MKESSFTLIEVVLCIAIVSFVLISLIGLFSVGFSTNQQSIQESRATQAMNAVATGIWGMSTISSTNGIYMLASPLVANGTNVMLTNGTAASFSWGLDQNGLFTNANNFTQDPNLVGTVYVKLMPPANNIGAAGSAYISVAWPGYAQFVPSGSSGSWTKKQGFVETLIYFNEPSSF